MATLAAPEIRADNSLLIVDDDKPFLSRLAKAMEARGYSVRTAETLEAGKQAIRDSAPAYAVVDMRLEDGNGLDVIRMLREMRPDCRALVLTGYGNIATAVNAVKLGAVDYLVQARGRRRHPCGAHGLGRSEAEAAGEPHVGGSRPLGAHSARL